MRNHFAFLLRTAVGFSGCRICVDCPFDNAGERQGLNAEMAQHVQRLGAVVVAVGEDVGEDRAAG